MPTPLTPEQRRQRARIAANTRWKNTDPVEASAAARAGFLAKFENEVDPNRVLTPEERSRRANVALRLHMQRLAFKSSKARRGRSSSPQPRPAA